MAKKAKLMALDVGPDAELDSEMQAYFAKCEEKLGFVPNVFKAYAFDNTKLRAFLLMSDDLMLGDSGLSKLEREMIAVAVSSVNHCHYCLTSHGAAVRQRAKDPEMGELMVQNYRAADLCGSPRRPTRSRRRTAKRYARPGSTIATSGISPQSLPSTTCQTGWRPPPT